MRKSTRKTILISAIVLIAIAALALGIYAISSDSLGLNWFERQPVVIRINNDQVRAGDFARSYSNYVSNIDMYNLYAQWGLGGTYIDTSEEGWENTVKNLIVDDFIQTRLYAQKASEYDLTLTAEDKAQMKQAGKDAVQSLQDECLTYAIQNGYAGTAAVEALKAAQDDSEIEDVLAYLKENGYINSSAENQAQKLLNQALVNLGYTLPQYRKEAERSEYWQIMAQKFSDYYKESIYVQDDSKLEDVYTEYATTYFEEAYAEGDWAYYMNAYMNEQMSYPSLFIPEAALFIRYIDAGEDAEGLARAEDLMAQLESGKKFETLVASEENQNEFGRSYKEPYAIMPNDNFLVEEVYTATVALEVGEYALVTSSTTTAAEEEGEEDVVTLHYYIVLRTTGTTGILAYEKVEEAIHDTLISYDQGKGLSALYAEWEENAQISIDDKRINKLMGIS